MKNIYMICFLFTAVVLDQTDSKIQDIINAISAVRIESNIKTLTKFGTRNTFSDTISHTRGIGAARRWIKVEFETISKECDTCLEVFYQKYFVTKEGNNRVPHDAWIVNVLAVQKGSKVEVKILKLKNRIIKIIRFFSFSILN